MKITMKKCSVMKYIVQLELTSNGAIEIRHCSSS